MKDYLSRIVVKVGHPAYMRTRYVSHSGAFVARPEKAKRFTKLEYAAIVAKNLNDVWGDDGYIFWAGELYKDDEPRGVK